MTKKTTAPTREETLALYGAARRFRAAEPWQAMCDSEVFGVRDPEKGTTGYCCVMGQMGEYHAMHVYLGGEGIAGYRAIQDASGGWPSKPCPLNLFLVGKSQVNLVVEFRGAAEVPRVEKAALKALDLTFRGRHAWPRFERNDPGLESRGLDAGETRFLTAAIEQALLVSERIQADETVLTGPLQADRVLVRVPIIREGATAWEDVVEPFETTHAPVPDPVPEAVLRAVEALPSRDGFVELAHTFVPTLIKSHKAERGSFPRLLLAVDAGNGMILGYHLFREGEFPGGVLGRVAAMLKKIGVRPRNLMLSDRWLCHVIGEGLPILQPSLKLVHRIEAAEAAYQSLAGFLGG
jgi:hypothetical protein